MQVKINQLTYTASTFVSATVTNPNNIVPHVVENGETEKDINILHTTKQTNICHFVFCIHLNN